MARVSDRHIRQLKPFLVGEHAKPNGEWDMHCPLHADNKRSASLNVLTGQWFCHAEGRGGGVLDLIRAKSQWVPFDAAATNGSSSRSGSASNGSSGAPAEREPLSMGMVGGWHTLLMRDESALDDLITARGVHTKTIIDRQIGYNPAGRHYTIPVFGPEREIWNVRKYDMYAKEGRRKIWSTNGWGSPPRLYPYDQLEHDRLVIGEGEWDILLTIQNGYPAITKTAGATMWDYGWNELFKDKLIYLALDRDDDGQKGATKIARALHRVADVRMVELPYEILPKHGQDLTDFWMEHDRGDFEVLLADAKPWRRAAEKTNDPDVTTVLDSFDAHKVGEPVKLQVTIKGKKEPGYSVPHKANLSCTRDRGPVCQACPLNGSGQMEYVLEPQSPAILGLLDERAGSVGIAIGNDVGIPGSKSGTCPKLAIEVTDHQAVEILFARPSIDHSDGTQAKDYKNVKITSVGRHDTMANTTVVATGALYPGPKDQRNEFLAWKIEEQETSVDRFQMSPEAIRLMKNFQPTGRQTPLKKLSVINKEFAAHVTRIVGRPEMHALMDLTYHSVLSFKFGGQLVHRGWLESLVVGDTRTGKSEAGERLVRHFGAGEIVGGEAATLAGLIGGMQQIGGKDWTVTWGVIPINDRRLVIIDELSGLHPDEIAKMSDVRASGMARLTKILQEVTFARTRLLWLGNPRHGDMSNYTYGVDAVRPLIGNPEDVARFDLVMAVAQGDVPPEDYNKPPVEGVLHYPSEACHTLLMWVWTRRADQIVWAAGAEDHVYKLAMEMGKRYTEDPPILQAANARIKIARVAAALAARTFSTDETHEKVIITEQHVEDAVSFMDTVYSLDSFGYAERSRERLDDIAEAESNVDGIRTYLLERKGLAKFLRSNPSFRRQDLEEILNLDREACNAVINRLWNSRMVRKEGANVKVEPTLHGVLREVRW